MNVTSGARSGDDPEVQPDSARKKIGFLTVEDARDRRTWSGTVYFMSEALQRNCGDVVFLGPLDTYWTRLGKLINYISSRLIGKKYDYIRAKWYAKRLSAIVQKRVRSQKLDYIVAPAAASALAYLNRTSAPVLFVSDTTFALVNNYYAGFSGYLSISVRDGHRLAKQAMQRADIVSFPSQWAADSAIRDYGVPTGKVQVIPFGANLDPVPSADIAMCRERSGQCRLLFLGVDWERKGGDIAFEALECLEEIHGIKAHLTICGCQVPEGIAHERINAVGFLDKRDPIQAEQLSRLFIETDYLLLPTRSECYGMVFCEASAYGVPSISADTGGVSGAIAESRNGFLLPASARGDQYARLIASLEGNDHRYRELSRTSRQEYESRVNWDVWARRVGVLFDEFSVEANERP